MTKEHYNIKFIPTGNVFTLPKDVAKELLANDRGNYKILDDDFVDSVKVEVQDNGIYNKVIQVEKPNTTVELNVEVKKEKTIDELKAEADELGIKYAKNIGVAKLQAKIDEYKAK